MDDIYFQFHVRFLLLINFLRNSKIKPRLSIVSNIWMSIRNNKRQPTLTNVIRCNLFIIQNICKTGSNISKVHLFVVQIPKIGKVELKTVEFPTFFLQFHMPLACNLIYSSVFVKNF